MQRRLKPCAKASCSQLTRARYCEAHAAKEKELKAEKDRARGSAHSRGYTSQWRKASKAFLLKHPLCVTHEKRGRVKLATLVDHITPHRGDKALFWDRSNWQSMCASCHSRKTASEDGGFGNRRGG